MYARDFVQLYALLQEIEDASILDMTPNKFGKIQARATIAKIALDVCVLPKIQNVEILDEISTCKQSTNVNGSSGDDGVQV